MTSTQTLFTWIGEKDSKELQGDSKQLYSHSSKTSSIIASDKYHFDNLVFLVDIKSGEIRKKEQIENLKNIFVQPK